MDDGPPRTAIQHLRADVAKVERGDPTVSLGIAFEVAVLVGVPLFNVDAARLSEIKGQFEDRIALLPIRVTPVSNEGLDDNF